MPGDLENTKTPPTRGRIREPLSRPVAQRGCMTPDGYRAENHDWLDELTERQDGMRVGRDPMDMPTDVLTAAGHGPRQRQ